MIRHGCYSSALNVLVVSKSDIHRWIPSSFENLGTGMLAEHSFAKGVIFLPLITSILLQQISATMNNTRTLTHNEFLVSDGRWKIPIKHDTIIIGIVSLICDDVFQ